MKIKKAFLQAVSKGIHTYFEEKFTINGKVHKTDFIDAIVALLPSIKIRFIQTYNLDAFELDYENLMEDGSPELFIQRIDEQEVFFDLITNGLFKQYSDHIYPSEVSKFRNTLSKFHKYSSNFVKYKDTGLTKTVYVIEHEQVFVYMLSQSVASSSKNIKILGNLEDTISVDQLITLVNTKKVFPVCLMCEGYVESFLDQNTLKYNNCCPDCSLILDNLPLVKAADRKKFLQRFCVTCTGLFLQESDYLQDRLVESWNE
jgi:hypothetical protein